MKLESFGSEEGLDRLEALFQICGLVTEILRMKSFNT